MITYVHVCMHSFSSFYNIKFVSVSLPYGNHVLLIMLVMFHFVQNYI